MSLLWYTPITALGMQLLGLAHTISFLEGSLGSLWMWNLDFKVEAKMVPLASPTTSHS